MFLDQDIKGDDLPLGSVCLSYDDGPGPQTGELGRYLHAEGISAAFFVMGQHAEGRADVLHELRARGHLIGNHTYNHRGLVAWALRGRDVVGELTRTDALIRPYVRGERVLFRAPYGNWRARVAPGSTEDQRVSIVAAILNRSGRCADYAGPVNWDINATDYDFWRRGEGAQACAAALLEKTQRIGRGIILMHDSSDEEQIRRNNRVLELTQLVVPALKARGFRFVPLDEVPQVRLFSGGSQTRAARRAAQCQLPELSS